MAIYHFSAQVIKRSAGKSSTAAAAYRSGQRIEDARTGEVHDYTRRDDVDYSIILAPEGVPGWVQDRAALWNEVEQAEKRKDSQVAREIDIALPVELSNEQKVNLISEFVRNEFVKLGMVVDLNVHGINSHNPHVHLLITMRSIDKEGFGKKDRSWNDVLLVERWREQWAATANKHLSLAGHSARIDHRSLAAQGIERAPQIHLGKANADKMKLGETNERIERYKTIATENEYIKVSREIDNTPDDVFLKLQEETEFLISKKEKDLRAVSGTKSELTAAEIKRRYRQAGRELEASRERIEQHRADLKAAWLPLSVKANKARKGITKEAAKQSSLKRIMRRLKDAWQAMRFRGELSAEISVLGAIKARIKPRLQQIDAKNVNLEQQNDKKVERTRKRDWQDLEP